MIAAGGCFFYWPGGVTEELIYTVGDNDLLARLAKYDISSDGEHIAFVMKNGSRVFVVCDGKSDPSHNEISRLSFAPKGSDLAYIASDDDGDRLVYNGIEGQRYDQLVWPCGSDKRLYYRPVFSADGNHLAYIAQCGEMQVVVLDGKELWKYKDIRWIGFSSDGSHSELVENPHIRGKNAVREIKFSPDGNSLSLIIFAYDKSIVIVDGKECPIYDEVSWTVFDPLGKHFAYIAYLDGKGFVVLDGVAGEKFDEIGWQMFSSCGGRLAYMGKRGEKWSLVVDGVNIPDILGYNFSPDGKHFAYSYKLGTTAAVVRDGKVGRTDFDKVSELTFSPDSKRLMYVGVKGGDEYCVVDDKDDGRFGTVGRRRFSDDGKHFAYAIESGGVVNVVLDGAVIGTHEDYIHDMRFFPGENRLAYVVRYNGKCMVVSDGLASDWYERVGDFYFSPDGKHFAYVARDEGNGFQRRVNEIADKINHWQVFDLKERTVVVLDGREVAEYSSVSRATFRVDGTLVFYGVRDGKLYKVTVKP